MNNTSVMDDLNAIAEDAAHCIILCKIPSVGDRKARFIEVRGAFSHGTPSEADLKELFRQLHMYDREEHLTLLQLLADPLLPWSFTSERKGLSIPKQRNASKRFLDEFLYCILNGEPRLVKTLQ